MELGNSWLTEVTWARIGSCQLKVLTSCQLESRNAEGRNRNENQCQSNMKAQPSTLKREATRNLKCIVSARDLIRTEDSFVMLLSTYFHSSTEWTYHFPQNGSRSGSNLRAVRRFLLSPPREIYYTSMVIALARIRGRQELLSKTNFGMSSET